MRMFYGSRFGSPSGVTPLFHRFTALLLLAAHLVTGTSALPALAALAAGLEGSHAVIVVQSQHGTKIFLHHEHEFTPRVADHKSHLARWIVRLCKNSGVGDHLLATERVSQGCNEEETDALVKKTATSELPSCHDLRTVGLRAMQR
jgi:hypothetical protein